MFDWVLYKPLFFLTPPVTNAALYKRKIKLILPTLIRMITVYSKSKVTKNIFNL